MKTSLLRSSGIVALLSLTALTACVTAPQGPRVAIMPTPGKPLELFSQEDQYCRGYAQQSVGPDRGNESAVGAAVVGTILGAAVGSAMSGRHHDNTAAGAATGLVMGTAIGAGNAQQEGRSAQQRYDIAYQQCMVSKNNVPAQGTAYRRAPPVVYVQQAPAVAAPPAPPPGYYPPPPAYYPPPPPQ